MFQAAIWVESLGKVTPPLQGRGYGCGERERAVVPRFLQVEEEEWVLFPDGAPVLVVRVRSLWLAGEVREEVVRIEARAAEEIKAAAVELVGARIW